MHDARVVPIVMVLMTHVWAVSAADPAAAGSIVAVDGAQDSGERAGGVPVHERTQTAFPTDTRAMSMTARESPAPVQVPPEVRPPRGDSLSPPELEDWMARALREHPRLVRLNERVKAAAARAPAAGALEDPTASLTYQNDTLDSWTLGSSEFSQAVVSWTQPLPGRGKRSLRRESAQRSAEALQPLVHRAELDLRRDILRAWWSLAFQLETRSALRDEKTLLDQIEGLTRDRYSLGIADQREVLRAQIEKTRIDEAVATVEGVMDALREELRGLLLLAPSDSLPDPGPLPRLPEPPSADRALADSLARSPEVEAVERTTSAAEANLAVARQESHPDYSIGGSYMYRGSLDPMISVSVGVRLPLFRRSRLTPSLDAASRDLSETQAAREEAVILLRTRTEQRTRTLRAARESVRLLEEVLLPQDRLSFDAELASYRTGRGESVTLLGILGTILRDKLAVSEKRLQIVLETLEMDALSLAPPSGMTSIQAAFPIIGAASAWKAPRENVRDTAPSGTAPSMGGMP